MLGVPVGNAGFVEGWLRGNQGQQDRGRGLRKAAHASHRLERCFAC